MGTVGGVEKIGSRGEGWEGWRVIKVEDWRVGIVG